MQTLVLVIADRFVRGTGRCRPRLGHWSPRALVIYALGISGPVVVSG
jgi:hypothetical protein